MSDPGFADWSGRQETLRPLICLAGSVLLTVDKQGEVKAWDVRSKIRNLLPEASKHADKENELPSLTVAPQPAVCSRATHLCLSRDGNTAALAGCRSEEPELLRVGALDLHGKRSKFAQQGSAVEACSAHLLGESVFAPRPGLQVLQMDFHPGSAEHILMLTSDNVLRLFNIHQPHAAEQCFELQLSSSRALGLTSMRQRQAVAFVCGPAHGWLRFTVFILCSDGSMFALCPIAPFGSSVNQAAVQQLGAEPSSSGDSLTNTATSLWLQQAFALPTFTARADSPNGLSPTASPEHKHESLIRPYALEDYMPGLLGPLPVSTSNSEPADDSDDDSEAGGADLACSLTIIGFGDSCTALVAASTSGMLSAFLLASQPEPTWTHGSPECMTQHGSIAAVRSEVPVVSQDAWQLLMLDQVSLPDCSPAPGDELSDGSGVAVRLFADGAMPDRVLVCTTSAAYAVSFPWILILANRMASEDPSWDTMPRYTAAAATGSVLTGAAVAVLDVSGHPDFLCLPPSHVKGKATLERAPTAVVPSPQPAEVPANRELAAQDAQITARYRDLRAPPPTAALPQHTKEAKTQSPARQAYLSSSIDALRTCHVEFQHKAHLTLTQRLEELEEAVQEQASQAQEIEDHRQHTADAQSSLTKRLELCSQLQDNLHARARLLADLHWGLAHALSPAEEELRDTVLPDLECSGRHLAAQVQGMRERVKSLGISVPYPKAPKMPAADSSRSPVPPDQMRRIRSALGKQAGLVAAAKEALDQLERMLRT
ncbi:hypothetical protein WJX73_009600 [Symbiochloris irregularis]|uniref:Uncharacterized protein n=1 Tax=Symbiochloris irregularis TaxID=706552 RepID=A0AAW1P6F2_9CHLO